MRQTLQAKLDAYYRQHGAIMAAVEALDAERLHARPQRDQWSILEIIEHLVISERWILGDLPDFSLLVARPQAGKDRLMFRIVMLVLKYHVPVPVPGQAGLPKGDVSLPDLRARWEESQQWLRRYVNGLTEARMDGAVFAHPVAGPLTIAQALDMGLLHLKYHDRQIRQRLASKPTNKTG